MHYDRTVDVLRRYIRPLEAFSNMFLGIGYLIVLVIASVMAAYACVNLQNKVVFESSAGLWDGRCTVESCHGIEIFLNVYPRKGLRFMKAIRQPSQLS